MRYIFGDWEKLSERISGPERVFLCVDFDGTITPIRPRPKDAKLNKNIRQLLRKISKNGAFFVGIISGRSLKDIKEKVGLKSLIFAGNHGLEIVYKNKKFIYPQAKRFIPAISKLGRALRKELKAFPEAVLEEKALSLSLHYRLVKGLRLRRLKKLFLRLSAPYLAARKIKRTCGKKVWEVRPPIKWGKGEAVLWLLRRLKSKNILPVYIGDDLTDEDAFRAVNKIGGISVLVGRRKGSSAKYYLKSIKDTEKFLAEIEQLKN